MSLVLRIALTHVRSRVRQTLVAVAGVATGVGFSVMMAALMEGSQNDYVRQLIDTQPHITVLDERRQATVQPAETSFDTAEIRGLTPQARRRGIKNPMAIVASLEGWVPGVMAPAARTQGIIRYAGRDVAAGLVGIDPQREPKVSATLAKHMSEGTPAALYRAANAVILGDRVAKRIGARVGSNLTVQGGNGTRVAAQVVGLHTAYTGGVYVLMKTAQVLAQQTGYVSEINVRLTDAMAAREVALRIERETGYQAVSWQESYEPVLNAFVVRNIIMYTIVGAILLVASFGTYNIISTITAEKMRDIAIMKSLGLRQSTVRSIFVVEAAMIGLMGAAVGWGLGYTLTRTLGGIQMMGSYLPVEYSLVHYAIATTVALAASLIAGYLPARKASRLHPVEIIRGAT